MMNPVAEMLTGWRQHDAKGKPVSSVFHIVNEDTRREVANPLSVVLETGTIQGLANHTVLIAADGLERPIDDSAAPIRDGRGAVLGAVLVFRDISARRVDERRVREALDEARASRALAEARQRDLEQALEVKNQFLAAVSHELRTPINAILGWASQLHAGSIRPERVGTTLASVDRNARALAQLIEDLLESSRLLTGKVRLAIADVDVRTIVHDAVDAVRVSAENKRVRLDVDVDHVPPVKGDADRLKQVIWNLLGNAIKFTPAGGSVLVRTGADNGAVTLSVIDTGMGIRPTVLPHIFEPFRQADETSQTGLGLGLAIARQLVEMHGGTIEAASDGPGRGSAFVIRIPSGYSERTGAAGPSSQGTTSSPDNL
jgi:PAS domain S-box-containing protein